MNVIRNDGNNGTLKRIDDIDCNTAVNDDTVVGKVIDKTVFFIAGQLRVLEMLLEENGSYQGKMKESFQVLSKALMDVQKNYKLENNSAKVASFVVAEQQTEDENEQDEVKDDSNKEHIVVIDIPNQPRISGNYSTVSNQLKKSTISHEENIKIFLEKVGKSRRSDCDLVPKIGRIKPPFTSLESVTEWVQDSNVESYGQFWDLLSILSAKYHPKASASLSSKEYNCRIDVAQALNCSIIELDLSFVVTLGQVPCAVPVHCARSKEKGHDGIDYGFFGSCISYEDWSGPDGVEHVLEKWIDEYCDKVRYFMKCRMETENIQKREEEKQDYDSPFPFMVAPHDILALKLLEGAKIQYKTICSIIGQFYRQLTCEGSIPKNKAWSLIGRYLQQVFHTIYVIRGDGRMATFHGNKSTKDKQEKVIAPILWSVLQSFEALNEFIQVGFSNRDFVQEEIVSIVLTEGKELSARLDSLEEASQQAMVNCWNQYETEIQKLRTIINEFRNEFQRNKTGQEHPSRRNSEGSIDDDESVKAQFCPTSVEEEKEEDNSSLMIGDGAGNVASAVVIFNESRNKFLRNKTSQEHSSSKQSEGSTTDDGGCAREKFCSTIVDKEKGENQENNSSFNTDDGTDNTESVAPLSITRNHLRFSVKREILHSKKSNEERNKRLEEVEAKVHTMGNVAGEVEELPFSSLEEVQQWVEDVNLTSFGEFWDLFSLLSSMDPALRTEENIGERRVIAAHRGYSLLEFDLNSTMGMKRPGPSFLEREHQLTRTYRTGEGGIYGEKDTDFGFFRLCASYGEWAGFEDYVFETMHEWLHDYCTFLEDTIQGDGLSLRKRLWQDDKKSLRSTTSKLLALKLLNGAKFQFDALNCFIKDFYDQLSCEGRGTMPYDMAWSLVGRCVDIIFNEMLPIRHKANQTRASIEPPCSDLQNNKRLIVTSSTIWCALQCYQILDSFAKVQFINHPLIQKEINAFDFYLSLPQKKSRKKNRRKRCSKQRRQQQQHNLRGF